MKRTLQTDMYTFKDMIVYVIHKPKIAEVYVETFGIGDLQYSFGVDINDVGLLDIPKLHRNGYFEICKGDET